MCGGRVMGILGMWTADLRDLSIISGAGCSISSAQKRTGSYSFLTSTNYRLGDFCFPLTAEGYARFAFYFDGAGNFTVRLGNGHPTTYNNYIKVLASSGVQILHPDSNTIYSASNAVIPGTGSWHVLEVHWLIHASTGYIDVKVDGIQSAQLLSHNTWVSDLVGVNLLYFDVASGCDYYIDDIIVRDDQWPGRGGIHVLTPNAGSTNEGWTASAGDPETCVDELPPVFTDYLSTDCTVDGTEHTVNVTDLAATPWNIRGVGVKAKVKPTVSTDAFARTLLQTGATKTPGATYGVETTGTWVDSYYALNPADSAVFEAADITNIEVGIESMVP
jgi:hypothetical protein